MIRNTIETRHRGYSRAFTIVETLVVVVVVGILLSISVPALRVASRHAVDAANLSRLRQHAQAFQVYSLDYDQQLPILIKPSQPQGRVTIGSLVINQFDYFNAFNVWPYALASGYYDGDSRSEVFQPVVSVFSPHARPEWILTDFWYSNSFLADPKFWNYETRTGPDQWRSTRQTEVSYTSKKVLIFTDISPEVRWSRLLLRTLAFVDGSASAIQFGKLREPYRFANGPWPGHGIFGTAIPGMHTIDGVRGRDID